MKDGFRHYRPDEREAKRVTSPLDMIEGFLDEDLEAASDPLEGATMAKVTVIRWKQDEPLDGQNLGGWNADTNDPVITSGSGTIGDYYRVDVPGNTTIDGITSWQSGQYLRFDGTWKRFAPIFYETETTAFIVNRDTGLTGSADYYFIAAKIGGEWRLVWLSCEAVRP